LPPRSSRWSRANRRWRQRRNRQRLPSGVRRWRIARAGACSHHADARSAQTRQRSRSQRLGTAMSGGLRLCHGPVGTRVTVSGDKLPLTRIPADLAHRQGQLEGRPPSIPRARVSRSPTMRRSGPTRPAACNTVTIRNGRRCARCARRGAWRGLPMCCRASAAASASISPACLRCRHLA
jgi:hypothetical protein